MKTDNKLLEENVAKTVYIVAAPTMIHMFLETSYHIIDAIWIGMLGSVALAAVASASFLLWLIFSCCSMVEIGVNSLVARYFGAGEKELQNEVSIFGIRFGIIVATIISLIFLPLLEPILNSMGLEPDVIYNGECFLIPILVGLPIFAITITCYAIFRGVGDTKTPLKILFFTLMINGLLAPILIFTANLGVSGGAIATVIAQSIAIALNITILKKRNLIKKVDNVFLKPEIIKQIAKIGFPISVNSVIFCIVYLFLTKTISQFGTAPIAALGIGHRVESFAYCVSVGFSIAATTLVGQSLGAKNTVRIREIAWSISAYACGLMFFISIIILLFKEAIAGIFTSDPAVIAAASGYLRAIAYTEIFLAVEIVMEGVFSGMGNTMPPTVIGLPLNILRLPAAYYFSGIFGIDGIWWTIGVSTVLKGLILVIWFKFTTISLPKTEAVHET